VNRRRPAGRNVWLAVLLAAAALAAGLTALAVRTPASGASFSTASNTAVTASADSESSWVHVYSRATDPDAADRPGYATQYDVTPAPPCATGQDDTIAITMGRFPWLSNATYQFYRVITLKAPPAFVDPSISAITVTTSLVADEDSGRQHLANARLAPVGGTGGSTSVTLAPGQKVQLNLQVTTTWWWAIFWGTTYRPHLRLTVSFPGAPAGYYVYDYEVLVTLA
jgi:hypothetical protein